MVIWYIAAAAASKMAPVAADAAIIQTGVYSVSGRITARAPVFTETASPYRSEYSRTEESKIHGSTVSSTRFSDAISATPQICSRSGEADRLSVISLKRLFR